MRWSELLCDDRIRSYRTKSKNDLRTEFEKDYHRIIQSASFRRLQDKTQVFPLDQSDFIRTRLTHSLEVSSYGKSLGQNIARKIIEEIRDPEFAPSYAMDICDILQCAELLHDIGNPRGYSYMDQREELRLTNQERKMRIWALMWKRFSEKTCSRSVR